MGFTPSQWHFDIDRFLNPFVPASPLGRAPYLLSYPLGYRRVPPRPLGNIAIMWWAFVGVFCSLAIIQVVGRQVPSFVDHGAPTIIGSFGAAAVLEFYAIESPLAQPRNAVVGQAIAALAGVSICKLFALSPSFPQLRWLAAALSCASATSLMALTGTVHPPAGATALIAVADNTVAALGWYLIPVVLLGCVLMQSVALLINNIQRRYPVYWWTPEVVGGYWNNKTTPIAGTEVGSKFALAAEDVEATGGHVEARRVVISKGLVVAPESMYLRPEEKLLLEALSQRL